MRWHHSTGSMTPSFLAADLGALSLASELELGSLCGCSRAWRDS